MQFSSVISAGSETSEDSTLILTDSSDYGIKLMNELASSHIPFGDAWESVKFVNDG